MTNSTKTQRPRALLALLGFVLAIGSAGCSSIFSGGCGHNDSTSCECICSNTGAAQFCGSQTDLAGSQACENDCQKMNTPEGVICDDASDHVVSTQTNPPTCPAGETFAAWVFCETCTDEPNFEQNIVASDCTKDEALADARARFKESDETCSIDECPSE
jgi:hypothetical protein